MYNNFCLTVNTPTDVFNLVVFVLILFTQFTIFFLLIYAITAYKINVQQLNINCIKVDNIVTTEYKKMQLFCHHDYQHVVFVGEAHC